jgi:hypothetical protein
MCFRFGCILYLLLKAHKNELTTSTDTATDTTDVLSLRLLNSLLSFCFQNSSDAPMKPSPCMSILESIHFSKFRKSLLAANEARSKMKK